MRTVTLVRRTLTRRPPVARLQCARSPTRKTSQPTCNAAPARPVPSINKSDVDHGLSNLSNTFNGRHYQESRAQEPNGDCEIKRAAHPQAMHLLTYRPSFQATRPIIPLPVLRPLTPVRCGKPSNGDLEPPASSRALSLWFMSIQLSTKSIQQIQPIFNREEELRVFRSYISATESDASFVVVIGPPSTGKSTILTKIKQERDQLRKNRWDAAPVILIDCRGTDVTTPEGFAAAARMQIGGWRWNLGRFLNKVWAKHLFSSSLLSHYWIPDRET
jgi:hypothetical protein